MREPFGDYVLEERLAQNGYVEVFLATRVADRARLIIKRLTGSAALDLLQRDTNLQAELEHPNIVAVLDRGEIEGRYFVGLEYVDGRDLLRTLAQCGKARKGFPTDIALHLVICVLRALEHAHERHILHGDISPSNVLLSFDGKVKLTDFAKSDPLGAIVGHIGYMSPEQISGIPLDARSDVFGTGILLFELLSGHRLFGRDKNRYEILEKNLSATIDPPLEYYRKDLSVHLKDLTMRALQKDRAHRFQSAREFADQLQDYVNHARAALRAEHLGQFMRDVFHIQRAPDPPPPEEPVDPHALLREIERKLQDRLKRALLGSGGRERNIALLAVLDRQRIKPGDYLRERLRRMLREGIAPDLEIIGGWLNLDPSLADPLREILQIPRDLDGELQRAAELRRAPSEASPSDLQGLRRLAARI